MGKGRRNLVGLVAAVAIAGMAFALPAGAAPAGGSGDASSHATSAKKKKKCKKGKQAGAAKKKCKKKGGSYVPGRYSGTYAENNVDLFFNVAGGRVFTGPFDTFYIDAPCSEGLSDISTIEPVQASIRGDGSFAGSGVWVVGSGPSGFSVPWTLTGRIAGKSISNGVFSVGPYTYPFSTKTCSGSTHFTAAWYASGTL
jgi:hypothetical protein